MRPDYQKIVQALNLIASKCGRGKLNRMKAIKLLYLSDRYHLRRYGRPLSFDKYVAMKNGAVGSVAKDITYDTDFLDDEVRLYAQQYLRPVGEHNYESLKHVDFDVFSETDKEALEFAVLQFGKYSQWDLKDITHIFPEWKRHEKDTLETGSSTPMDYQDFFEDPLESDPLFRKYFPKGDPFKSISNEAAKESFLEESEQQNLWK